MYRRGGVFYIIAERKKGVELMLKFSIPEPNQMSCSKQGLGLVYPKIYVGPKNL